MSEKSSNNSDETVAAKPQHKKRQYQWKMLGLLPLWVGGAFLVSNLIVAAVLLVLGWFHISLETYLRPAILQTVIATVIYVITIAIVIAVPYKWGRRTDLNILGLQRLPSWTDIGLTPVAFVVYTLIVTILLALLASWFPALPLNEAQDVGFKSLGSRVDNMMAFVTLVVLAPLAEETLFRGYLYGKLKRYVPAIWAAVATSLLFGVAHFQLNVGIDVFVLSLILCGLRSLTGSIWAGVLVHMTKNALAYYLLFIRPLIGG
jgi:membrane protease YdiL (CAAX protease family)